MNDGIPGCGGRGGAGGLGGRGGGSSIALFVWGATANVVGGSLVAGNGGQGTVGGTGGNGGPGAAGTEGTKGAICRTGSCIYQTTNGCQALLTNAQGMGGFGGSGGPGGPGGQGGAGAGGSSFALFKGTGAGVTVSGSTTLTIGPAGTSAGNGAAGVAKTVGP